MASSHHHVGDKYPEEVVGAPKHLPSIGEDRSVSITTIHDPERRFLEEAEQRPAGTHPNVGPGRSMSLPMPMPGGLNLPTMPEPSTSISMPIPIPGISMPEPDPYLAPASWYESKGVQTLGGFEDEGNDGLLGAELAGEWLSPGSDQGEDKTDRTTFYSAQSETRSYETLQDPRLGLRPDSRNTLGTQSQARSTPEPLAGFDTTMPQPQLGQNPPSSYRENDSLYTSGRPSYDRDARSALSPTPTRSTGRPSVDGRPSGESIPNRPQRAERPAAADTQYNQPTPTARIPPDRAALAPPTAAPAAGRSSARPSGDTRPSYENTRPSYENQNQSPSTPIARPSRPAAETRLTPSTTTATRPGAPPPTQRPAQPTTAQRPPVDDHATVKPSRLNKVNDPPIAPQTGPVPQRVNGSAAKPTPQSQPHPTITIPPKREEAPKPAPPQRPGGLERNASVSTRYVAMLLELDTIPTLQNLLASFFTWILLAGFLLSPGTFTSFTTTLASTGTALDTQWLLNRVNSIPLLVIAELCSLIGASGMVWQWWKWHKNYIWITNRIFLPGLLNSLAGVISTLVNVFGSQHGHFSVTAKVTIGVVAGCAGTCGILTAFYMLVLLAGVKKEHERQFGVGSGVGMASKAKRKSV